MKTRFARLLPVLTAVLGVLLYWYSTHPPFARGYTSDICNHEMARQLMHEQIRDFGKPHFFSDHVMAPAGMNLSFFAGWNLERDWIGSYVWGWNRDFPYEWVYYGVSLLLCLAASGYFLRRLGLGPWTSWLLALLATVDNLPRHMKLWHHSDNVMLHWIYAGFFLDAWIWQRAVRDRRWSVHLEVWRAFLILGTLGTMGYNWGATLLEWECVRVSLAILAWRGRKTGSRIKVEWEPRKALLPVLLGLPLLALDLRWFVPLVTEALKEGVISQGNAYFVHLTRFFRPLFLEHLMRILGQPMPPIRDFMSTETVTIPGWSLLLPLFLTIYLVRRKAGGRGLKTIAPFLVIQALMVIYCTIDCGADHSPANWIQAVVPFLKFFRTVCRFTIFLPPLFVITWALAWPELTAFWKRLLGMRKLAAMVLGCFALISVLELSLLSWPTSAAPAISTDAEKLFEGVREQAGDTVLTFPFCVSGANGFCTSTMCHGTPWTMAGHCTRLFHDKKVYGAYTSRMTAPQCGLYDGAPFDGWFTAWRGERCFSDEQWVETCGYLKKHTELAALLVFPDLWGISKSPECLARLSKYLGPPLQTASFVTVDTRDGLGGHPAEVRWYPPRCQASVTELPTKL